MRSVILYSVAGAVLIGLIQFYNMTGDPSGTTGGIMFYLPMLLYFAFIYIAIKRTKSEQPDGRLPFTTGLKAGGVAALIMCLAWGISFFVGLTHQDIPAIVSYMRANGQEAQIKDMLASYNRDHMFEVTKFWIMPNFLLGFLVIVLATVILARRKS